MFDIPQGVSDAAYITDSCNAEIQIQSQQTATGYNHELEGSLATALKDGSSAEWLADGNQQIQASTIMFAKAFIESLPVNFQSPTIEPEPDGDISIEWYKEKRRLLSASISSVGSIEWAALLGSEDPRGTITFTGKAPETIVFYLSSILA